MSDVSDTSDVSDAREHARDDTEGHGGVTWRRGSVPPTCARTHVARRRHMPCGPRARGEGGRGRHECRNTHMQVCGGEVRYGALRCQAVRRRHNRAAPSDAAAAAVRSDVAAVRCRRYEAMQRRSEAMRGRVNRSCGNGQLLSSVLTFSINSIAIQFTANSLSIQYQFTILCHLLSSVLAFSINSLASLRDSHISAGRSLAHVDGRHHVLPACLPACRRAASCLPAYHIGDPLRNPAMVPCESCLTIISVEG